MPISRKEFESGHIMNQLEGTVIAFLQSNRGSAYTMGEIMEGINIQASFSDLWKTIVSGLFIFGFADFLNNLVIQGKIKSNIINGTNYYMAN